MTPFTLLLFIIIEKIMEDLQFFRMSEERSSVLSLQTVILNLTNMSDVTFYYFLLRFNCKFICIEDLVV